MTNYHHICESKLLDRTFQDTHNILYNVMARPICIIRISSLMFSISCFIKKITLLSIITIFRVIKKFTCNYPKELPTGFNTNDKFKLKKNVISHITDNKTAQEAFEICKKWDDIIFCVEEICKKKKCVITNSLLLIRNLQKILFILLNVYFKYDYIAHFVRIVIINQCHVLCLRYMVTIGLIAFIIASVRTGSVFLCLKTLKKIDDIILCMVRLRISFRDLTKSLDKLANTNSQHNDLAYMICFSILKIMRKLLECTVFISKGLRFTTELSTQVLHELETLQYKMPI
ncbi:hypothetical protein COBT_003028 [Conglomerata obtusa]